MDEITLSVYKDDILMLRLADYNDRVGRQFSDVIKRVERGKINGNLSFMSLYNFDRKLFKTLDQLEDRFSSFYTTEDVSAVYGPRKLENGAPNPEHYKLIAKDAQVLYQNYWKMSKEGRL